MNAELDEILYSLNESADSGAVNLITAREAVTKAFKAGMTEAAKIVIDATKIPKDAKHPTRDYIVLLGEEISGMITTARDKKEVV